MTVFGEIGGPITVTYMEKGSTIDYTAYCSTLEQVKKDVKNKRRGAQSQGVILHQDNARPHTAAPNYRQNL